MIKIIDNYPDIIIKPVISNNKKTIYSCSNDIKILIENTPEADLCFFKNTENYKTIIVGSMGKIKYSLPNNTYMICNKNSYFDRQEFKRLIREAEFLTNINY